MMMMTKVSSIYTNDKNIITKQSDGNDDNKDDDEKEEEEEKHIDYNGMDTSKRTPLGDDLKS